MVSRTRTVKRISSLTRVSHRGAAWLVKTGAAMQISPNRMRRGPDNGRGGCRTPPMTCIGSGRDSLYITCTASFGFTVPPRTTKA